MAGFHSGLLHLTKGFDKKWVDIQIHSEINLISDSTKLGEGSLIYPMLNYFGIGTARGGTLKKGGLLWQDWFEEFEPIEGLNQIVGHTHSERIHYKNTDNSINVNVDCFPKFIISIVDGKITEIPVE